jgi:hypothetical protein
MDLRFRLVVAKHQQSRERNARGEKQRDPPEGELESSTVVYPWPRAAPSIVEEEGVRAPNTLFQEDTCRVCVPNGRQCELRVYVTETTGNNPPRSTTIRADPGDIVTLPPGIHRLRWDARGDAVGTKIYYGVQIDDRWVIRGMQPRSWPVTTVSESSRFRPFIGAKPVHYQLRRTFFPATPGKPTTTVFVSLREL